MKKDSGVTAWKVTSGILLIIILIGGFYLISNSSEKESKALLDVQVYQWAENIDNADEMFFDYYIYNYGDGEAKNIAVKCELIEDDLKTRRVSIIDRPGNLASRSDSFEEVVTDNPYSIQGEEFIGVCYVQSCDNCEILYKRIPELIKSYED